jgi:hypothetical protein
MLQQTWRRALPDSATKHDHTRETSLILLWISQEIWLSSLNYNIRDDNVTAGRPVNIPKNTPECPIKK